MMPTELDVLRKYQQDAPVNIEALIGELGIVLDKKANLDPEISGQIERLEDGMYKISANISDHYYRQRFTMAHELAHYLFHRALIGDGVDDNRAYRSTAVGKFYNGNITSRHETQANQFAASILMPEELVRVSCMQFARNLDQLSRKFQVSKNAMNIRLDTLMI